MDQAAAKHFVSVSPSVKKFLLHLAGDFVKLKYLYSVFHPSDGKELWHLISLLAVSQFLQQRQGWQ